MGRVRELVRTRGADVLVALLALGGAAEVLVRDDVPRVSGIPVRLLALALALVVLPLLARRRFPFLGPALVWVLSAALSIVDGRVVVVLFSVYLAGLASAFLLGSLRNARQAGTGLVVVIGAAAVVVGNDPDRSAASLFFLPVIFGLAWLAGLTGRWRAERAEAAEHRAELAERARESAARIAVAEERARITRELHDVVAHSVSVMVLQVGAVRHRMPAAMTAERDALHDVEQVGRSALVEMRRLLGALAPGGPDAERGPQPGLDDLAALAEKVRGAGLEVGVHVEGEPVALPRAVDLSAYRIVQEGLTNVLKHAAARRAEVTLRYRTDAVQLEIRDDGVGPRPGDGFGRGLLGIGERVKIYGGRMSAGAAAGGGYLLTARLPVDGPTPPMDGARLPVDGPTPPMDGGEA